MKEMDEGERRKQKGMQLALFGAENKITNWGYRARKQLERFLYRVDWGHEFFTEDVREFAYKQGLPMPGDQRAWGGIMARAGNDGIIIHIGYGKVKSPNCHKGIGSIWMKPYPENYRGGNL